MPWRGGIDAPGALAGADTKGGNGSIRQPISSTGDTILGKAQWRSDGIDTNGRGVQDPNKTSNDKSGVDKADSPNDSDKYYQEGDAGVDGRKDVIPISTLHGKNPQHIRTSSEVLTFVRANAAKTENRKSQQDRDGK